MSSSSAMGAGVLALALGLIFLVSFPAQCHAELKEGFYAGKCNLTDVERTVFNVVSRRIKNDTTLAAALIRLHFHDCFVNGCDASILIDGNSTEKNADANKSVRGYDVIDDAKAELEEACEQVVSCADIVAMAARDAVSLSGAGRYDVLTGRKDGLSSSASEVDLPSPRMTVNQSIEAFARRNLNVTDMVLLLGGHAIGVTHCSFFTYRLYNFQNTGKPDPTMDTFLLMKLRSLCPENSTDNRAVNLTQSFAGNSSNLDNSFYKQIYNLNRGVLQLDQLLALDPMTNGTVATIAKSNNADFLAKFGQAMVKLGTVNVLTGEQGEIRKFCNVKNSDLDLLPF